LNTLLHATVYFFLHNLLNVLVQIANRMRLQQNIFVNLCARFCILFFTSVCSVIQLNRLVARGNMCTFQLQDTSRFQNTLFILHLTLKVDNAIQYSLHLSRMCKVAGVDVHTDHPMVVPNNSTLFIIPLCARSDEQAASPLEN
jgi:hypothetical protein